MLKGQLRSNRAEHGARQKCIDWRMCFLQAGGLRVRDVRRKCLHRDQSEMMGKREGDHQPESVKGLLTSVAHMVSVIATHAIGFSTHGSIRLGACP